MIDLNAVDYSPLDVPEVLLRLFHPRPELSLASAQPPARDLLVPVDDHAVVGARFHPAAATAPTILFFHGNGEIVADYDELAPFYRRQGVNFLPVDYRGYGRSTGAPTVSAMMRDCHAVFTFARQWLPEMGYRGPLMVMGRSLGSASALELAVAYPGEVAALIVESGFAYAGPLLQLLGVNLAAIGFKETAGFRNVDKIRAYPGPTLIIHAEHDHIIPVSDGQALYDAAAAPDKTLLKIPHANHNDILFQGGAAYMTAIQALAARISRG
ncbi:MAG: alpha/beta hydrolase [Deltaproteobacteria bacterium]|nr:alpha/beta hydrolase [Deltaproteobacteria bacterium]